MTASVSGMGTLFKMGDGASPEVFAAIAEVKSISGPESSLEMIDVTNFDSPNNYRERIPALLDAGTVALECNFTNSANQVAVRTAHTARTLKHFKIVFPFSTPATCSFSGYIEKIGHGAQVADALNMSVSVQITSGLTWS